MELTSLYEEPDAPLAPDESPALEAVDVFRIFRSGPAETVALRGLDLRVERGEFIALLGPSGCGKSTFLHLAAGLDQPSAGEIRALGRPLSRLGEDELARYRAREIAIVFQGENLWPDLTARQNVELALRLTRTPRPVERARESLAEFGLSDRGSQRAGTLSGGEQQRVAIAAAAARHATLVLCDEPTGELDVANERLVIEALEQLRSRHAATVVVVTHSELVAAAADRTIELRDGRVV